ncbi:phytase [Streptomyces sp. T-3]|nr:phytase [Streptomyces sp. T-3]
MGQLPGWRGRCGRCASPRCRPRPRRRRRSLCCRAGRRCSRSPRRCAECGPRGVVRLQRTLLVRPHHHGARRVRGLARRCYPNSTSGRVEQWEIGVNGSTVTATSVRLFGEGSAVAGCCADERNGKLYLGEEDVGVWGYGAEPGAGTARTELDSTGSGGHITADPEGITAAGNRLYVSSQGSNDFTAYDRSSGARLGRFSVANGSAADDCEDTDGIDAAASPLGSAFPQGVFVCQDGSSGTPGTSGNLNFKLVPLDRITAQLG